MTTYHPHAHLMHHDSGAAGLELALVEAEEKIEKERKQWHRGELYAVGRVMFALVFLVAAAFKIARFDATVDSLTDLGLADAPMLLGVGIAVEVIGGVMLLAGLWTRTVAIGLIAYLAIITLLVNSNLTLEMNRESAWMNLASCGALFMLLAHGSGVLSLDRWLEHRRARRAA